MKRKKDRTWTCAEAAKVWECLTLTDKQLAALLDRSEESVFCFRKRYGIKKPKDGRGQFRNGNISSRWQKQNAA